MAQAGENGGGGDHVRNQQRSGKRPAEEIINPAPMAGRKRGRRSLMIGGGGQSSGGKKKGKEVGEIGGDQDEPAGNGHIHIFTERERRKKMKDMFNTLHGLLPHLPPKTDKSTVVDESVKHIKTLERTVHRLQKQKQKQQQKPSTFGPTPATSNVSREAFLANQTMRNSMATIRNNGSLSEVPLNFQTWSAPNVVLSISGKDAFISICASKKRRILPAIFHVLEEYRLEVITAHVSSADTNRFMCIIHVHATGVSDRFIETSTLDEIYKTAADDIILLLN